MPEHTSQANIGVIGLAVMGSNLARNLASKPQNVVSIYNRTFAKTQELIAEHPEAGFIPCKTIDDFVASLASPKTAIIMVQAGTATDAVIQQLKERFSEGDIIIDGGNAHFQDTIDREKRIASSGIHFVGVGISGGEEGALNGPSIMPGGSEQAYATLEPIFSSIAAVAENEPCVTHVGSDGAGHFVKMVHNGIEYADMQLIAEAYDLLRSLSRLEPSRIADIFSTWNTSVLKSYLIEITAEVLRHTDQKTNKPFIDVVLDQAGSKGTGMWTAQTALSLDVPVSGIAEAVFARSLSSKSEHRKIVRSFSSKPHPLPAVDESFIEDVAQALYASKIIAYAQGFDVISAGAKQYNWNINNAQVSNIWRGGCIIRAQFLNRISEAYEENPNLTTLLEAPYFEQAIRTAQEAWRRVVVTATQAAIPIPGFASALSYFDALSATSLPTALVQGQRDFFGSHTYKRVDATGSFHTLWSDDRREIKTS